MKKHAVWSSHFLPGTILSTRKALCIQWLKLVSPSVLFLASKKEITKLLAFFNYMELHILC